MKHILLLCSALLISTFSFANNDPSPIVKTVNTSTSTITWKGYKVLGAHEGNIKVKEGEFSFDGNQLIGGSFIIDMPTINVTDLKAGDGKEKLEGHLKSDDFFGIEAYPTAKFEITKVVSRGAAGEYKIVGNITIKETTKEIKFNATINDTSAIAKLKIDRSDFDIKYGSGSFFDNLGDNTIYDEFDLNINLMF